jgi:SAM-dependent methyltransferase
MHTLNDWLATPQGQYVLRWELAKHELLLNDIFGFNAVQIGLPGQDYLAGNRMPFRFRCATAGLVQTFADAHQLPFASCSIDLVVLPHVLEFDPDPHRILREIERVLVPEGHVVVTGFNPFSLWGVRQRIRRDKGEAPWNGRYIGVSRLKDWFALLGFETRAGAFGCYAPAFGAEQNLQRFRFMESAGDRWWAFAGAVYIMQGIKRQHGMRLLTAPWHDRKLRAKAMVTVAQRVDNEGRAMRVEQ